MTRPQRAPTVIPLKALPEAAIEVPHSARCRSNIRDTSPHVRGQEERLASHEPRKPCVKARNTRRSSAKDQTGEARAPGGGPAARGKTRVGRRSAPHFEDHVGRSLGGASGAGEA